jgi:hypothetical protein
LDPTQLILLTLDNDVTVITSNVSTVQRRTMQIPNFAQLASKPIRVQIEPTHGIADTGATSIFVQEGIPVPNIQVAMYPLTVNLHDGRQVRLTHTCDVVVPGLPEPLTGHVIPDLAMASLFGIRPLCNAGCIVVFHNDRVEVRYKGKIILVGPRNASTYLWTLPLASTLKTIRPQLSLPSAIHNAMPTVIAAFTHSVWTRVNAVQFAHQALGNPKILTLLKAVRRGFLKGCPNMTKKLILKYLNPSPATAKGHMKRPRQGIRSTTPRSRCDAIIQHDAIAPIAYNDDPVMPPPDAENVDASEDDNVEKWDFPPIPHPGPANLIADDDSNQSIANVFAYGAFADKHSGVVYHDLTGSFPFMSLDGSICFFVLYHYESNSILAEPIKGLDDKTIFEAYKKYYLLLTEKGYSVKLNVMDNQATKYIKKVPYRQRMQIATR